MAILCDQSWGEIIDVVSYTGGDTLLCIIVRLSIASIIFYGFFTKNSFLAAAGFTPSLLQQIRSNVQLCPAITPTKIRDLTSVEFLGIGGSNS